MRIIFFIFIVKISRILPSVRRFSHTRWNSNEVLIAFRLLVSLIQAPFPFRCQKVVIRLTITLNLGPILVILISVTARCGIFLPRVARLAGSSFLAVVGHACTVLLISGDLFLVHEVDVLGIDGDLLLVEHGHWAIWPLVAHVGLGLDLEGVAATTGYILGAAPLRVLVPGEAKSLVERA